MTEPAPGRLAPPACPDCGLEWDHCHDVVVRHVDGSVECLGGVRCHAEAGRHGWWVECTEVLGQCGCREPH